MDCWTVSNTLHSVPDRKIVFVTVKAAEVVDSFYDVLLCGKEEVVFSVFLNSHRHLNGKRLFYILLWGNLVPRILWCTMMKSYNTGFGDQIISQLMLTWAGNMDLYSLNSISPVNTGPAALMKSSKCVLVRCCRNPSRLLYDFKQTERI